MSLRVALVTDWYLPRLGGIELHTRDLAERLIARGHEVEVITPFPGDAVVDGVPVHRLVVKRLWPWGVLHDHAGFRAVKHAIADGRYDVVHAHFNIYGPAAYCAAFYARWLGVPCVGTVHSVLRGFWPLLHYIRWRWAVGLWRVHWSAVSSVVARHMRPLIGASPVAILPNGVDPDWWRREPATDVTDRAGDAAREIRIVSVMRLWGRKRPAALLLAFAGVVRALPDHRVRLVIAGEGRQRERIERLVAEHGLAERVELLGQCTRETIRTLLHSADAFVMPSRLEAFGIAALEARAAGVPVIAMREGGARDFLRDGVDALLVDGDDAMMDAMRRVVEDATLRQRLALGAREPLPGLSWDEVVDAHEALYRHAIAARRAASRLVVAPRP